MNDTPTMDKPMNTPVRPRKPYQPPQLTVYGDVRVVTQALKLHLNRIDASSIRS